MSAVQQVPWNYDIAQNMGSRNSINLNNRERFPPLPTSPISHSGVKGMLFTRMGSMDSMESNLRSHRTQRTLDKIKDPKLFAERSLAQLIVDIDDKVLNFSKQNIDMTKAPKKGETLYAHQVKPDAVRNDVSKLEDSLARMS